MIINESDLLDKDVRHIVKDKTTYYSIEDIRKYYPYTKYPAEKIEHIDDVAMTRLEDIQQMSELDRNIYDMMKNRKAP